MTKPLSKEEKSKRAYGRGLRKAHPELSRGRAENLAAVLRSIRLSTPMDFSALRATRESLTVSQVRRAVADGKMLDEIGETDGGRYVIKSGEKAPAKKKPAARAKKAGVVKGSPYTATSKKVTAVAGDLTPKAKKQIKAVASKLTKTTIKEESARNRRIALAAAHKPKKKAAPPMSNQDRADMGAAVRIAHRFNYVSVNDVCNKVKAITPDRAQRALDNAVRLGRVRKYGEGSEPDQRRYYPVGSTPKSKKAPVARARKAEQIFLNTEDIVAMEEVVDFIRENCPADSPPVTVMEMVNDSDLSRSTVQRACHNAVKLGRLIRDGDGYRLVKGHKGAKKTVGTDNDAVLKEVNEKLARCLDELAKVEKLQAETRKQSATVEAALREKVELLEGEVVGWKLRSNVQVLTYRFERWEHDRLRDAYEKTVNWLESWLDGMGLGDSGEWTVDEWAAWAQRERETLRRGLAKMKPFQKRQRPLTEVMPEPPEDFHKMLAYLVSQDMPGAAWPTRKAARGG